MAISVVQSASIAAFSSPPVTFASNVTAGNTVLLAVAGYHSGAGAITTSSPVLGGSSVPGSTAFFNPGGTNGIISGLGADGLVVYVALWMLPNCPGGSGTVSWTTSGQSGLTGCFALEVAGLGASPVLDQSASGTGTSTTAVSTGSTGAATAAPEIVFAAAGIGEGYSNQPGAPWTVVSPSSNADGGYQIAVASGSNYTWSQTATGSGAWSAAVVTVAAGLAPQPAPVYPQRFPARGSLLPRRGGRITAIAGGPVVNPGVVPVQGALPVAVRAALPLVLRGRALSAAGTALRPPATSGPPFRPAPGPARARISQSRPRGRAVPNAGGPVVLVPPPSFTAGTLTATVAAQGTLTAAAQKTGGPS